MIGAASDNDCDPGRAPWLDRRTHAIGGSEVAPLLLAYGLAPLDATYPGWVLDSAEYYKRLGVPKLLAWKSGLQPEPEGDTTSKDRGNDREVELFQRYRAMVAELPKEAQLVDPKKMRHAQTFPREWFPLVDRHCHRLAITPDAVARDHRGDLVAIELKTTFKPCASASWHYLAQLEAEMAAMGAARGIVVVGDQWVADDVPDGPVRDFARRPDPVFTGLIRRTCIEAWGVVECLREIASEVAPLRARGAACADTKEGRREKRQLDKRRLALTKECGPIWERSVERMRAHRDPEVLRLDEVIAGFDEPELFESFAA